MSEGAGEFAASQGGQLRGRGWFARVIEPLTESLVTESDRWLLWVPVAVGLGIAFYFTLPVEPPIWVGPAGLGVAAVAGVAVRHQARLLILVAAVAAVGLGITAAQVRTAIVDAPVLTQELRAVMVTARVAEVQQLPSGSRLILERPQIQFLAPENTPRRIRVSVAAHDQPPLWPGMWVRLRASLAPPSAPAAPGAFDFQRHAFFQGIGAYGFAFGHAEPIDPPAGEKTESAAWHIRLAEIRQGLTRRVEDALPGGVGAIAAALTTGSRGAIPEDVIEAMRDSGLAHLLSISGLHMGLVAGILFFGLRGLLALIQPLALGYPIKKWAAVVALLGAFLYLLISGGTVPTQRSFLMTGVVLVAVLADRSAISMRLVAWAALVLLLVGPEAMVGPSFQMSFAAVVCLIAAYEATRDYRRRRRADAGWLRRFGHYAGDLAVTSLVATIATAPYAIYHFNRVADYSVAANMLAVPLTGIWIMPWAVIAFLLMPFGFERFGLVPMGWGIEAIITIAKTVAAWPGAVTLVPAMPVAALGLITLGGLWICLWQRRWRLYGLAGIAAGVFAMALVRPPDLLVSEDGKLVAVKNASGEMLFSSGRAARFDGGIWLRRAGQTERGPWPRDGYSADGRLACDALGCIYRNEGQVIALAWKPAALIEDCHVADLVVSAEPVRRACPSAKRVIDRFDLWRNGAHAVWITRNGVRIRSVREVRGARPWVVDPRQNPYGRVLNPPVQPRRLQTGDLNSGASGPPGVPES